MKPFAQDEIRRSERAHYVMQLSAYFSELVDLPGVRFAFTFRLTDTWYNQAYDIDWSRRDVDDLLKLVEQTCADRNRAPCYYVTPACMPSNLPTLLEQHGLALFEEEAWMFYPLDGPPIDLSSVTANIEVRELDFERDFEDFASVYRRGLPGPEVDAYIDAVRDGYRYAPPNVDVHYLLAYLDEQAVGMVSVLSTDACTGIYAVATLEHARRRGVARTLCARALDYANLNRSTYVFLQTVRGEDSEEAFARIGFETVFTRPGYSTPDVADTAEHG